jgi:hypothetical protein
MVKVSASISKSHIKTVPSTMSMSGKLAVEIKPPPQKRSVLDADVALRPTLFKPALPGKLSRLVLALAMPCK